MTYCIVGVCVIGSSVIEQVCRELKKSHTLKNAEETPNYFLKLGELVRDEPFGVGIPAQFKATCCWRRTFSPSPSPTATVLGMLNSDKVSYLKATLCTS